MECHQKKLQIFEQCVPCLISTPGDVKPTSWMLDYKIGLGQLPNGILDHIKEYILTHHLHM
eukprot:2014211-Ditylum_brightwellii.AAC.1